MDKQSPGDGKTAVITAIITGIVTITVTLITTNQLGCNKVNAAKNDSTIIQSKDSTDDNSTPITPSNFCADVVRTFNDMDNSFESLKSSKDFSRSSETANVFQTILDFDGYDSWILQTPNLTRFQVEIYNGNDKGTAEADFHYVQGRLDECLNQFKQTDDGENRDYILSNKKIVLDWNVDQSDTVNTYKVNILYSVNAK